METVDENDPVSTRLPSLHISILVLRTVMYTSAKTYPDICKDTSWHLQRHILTSAKIHAHICKGTSWHLQRYILTSAKTHPDICKDTSWHLQRHILTSAKTNPGASQATKINLFAKIIQVLLLIIFVKSTTIDVWRALITHLTYSKACSYLFHDGGPYHIETRANHTETRANQWTW